MSVLNFHRFLVIISLTFCGVYASEATALVEEIVGDLWQGKAVPDTKVTDFVVEIEKSLPASRASSVSSVDNEEPNRGSLVEGMSSLCELMMSKASREGGRQDVIESFLTSIRRESVAHPLAAFEALGHVISAY